MLADRTTTLRTLAIRTPLSVLSVAFLCLAAGVPAVAAQEIPGSPPATAAAAETGSSGPHDGLLSTPEARAAQDEFDRREIGRLLRRPEVRDAARTAGLEVERVETAMGELTREELRDVGERARGMNDALDLNNDTVVISTTTIIIALLVLILILVA